MRQILDYNGIKHFELEFLTGWFLDGEAKKESDGWKELLFTAAEALGARHVKVGHFVKDPAPMSRLIESFAALCSEAANHGTKILFELMPFGMIDTLTDTMTMIQGAGAKNGGVIFDLWHLVKLGISYDDVARVVGQCEVGVELNDGTFQCPWDLHEDTINHRRLCGEGEFDVKGFVAKMLKAGYTGPWGIEVLNAELRKLPLEEVVTRAFTTTMSQFPR
jgi:sugar phosphate isomerase/epimerase